MTDSLEAPTRTDSPATRDAAVPTLVLLPDDLIVEILVLFDVREILSLRQVCKAFAQATRLRALWVRLAHREVLDRNLLWPAYAFPLAFATRRTIEAHTLRAIGVDRQKPPRMFSQERRFSRCIFRPPNSVGWLRVVKGRWLILELRGQQLEVWDLQNKLETEPAALYDGLKGKIDGSSIDISEGSSVVLSFSESSHITTVLKINLPGFGECGSIPNFVQLDTFEGFSGLLDSHAGLAVFSHSASNKATLVRDMYTGSIVLFGGPEATERLQQQFSARILKDYIVLIGLYAMEFYSITGTRSLMTNSQEGSLPRVIHPVQSLAYPGGEVANHVEVLDLPLGRTELGLVNRESQFCLGMQLNRSTFWILLHVRLDSDASSATFTSSAKNIFRTGASRAFACCWGGSGQRLLLAIWHRDGWQVFCSAAPSCPNTTPSDFNDHIFFLWNAVRKWGQDFFAGFAFDDASGICVVATSLGRVWIDDYAKRLVPTCKVLEEGSNSWDVPLHPDPSWPILHPIPYPANVVYSPNTSYAQFGTPMPWSEEVEHYFPMMNDPNCYGGATWFVNEALHIPGSAALVMFTISALYPRNFPSTRVIQLAGGRLIAVETDMEMQNYRVKLLGPSIALTQIPRLLPGYRSIEGVVGVNLDADYAVVRRYAFWRNEVGGEFNGFPPGFW